jgi:ABC-type branched-subunit amino acid transport system substrate-binding protein
MRKRMALLCLTVLVSIAALAATVGANGATTEPIRLFIIIPVATPIQNYPDAIAGAQAAAQAINSRGGIKGRRIEISSCNTQSNANVAVACARQAVTERVTAVVASGSTLSALEIPILAQAGIPTIGYHSFGNPIDWTNPYVFPLVGGTATTYMSIPFAMKKLGKKRFVIVHQDVPSAFTNAKLVRNAARVAKLPVVGVIVMPGATTDFAPIAQRLRELNPDGVVLINSPGVSGGLIRSATSLGVRPLWSHNSGSIGEPEAAQIGAPAEGMLLGGIFPSFRDTGVAGIRRFVAEMQAAGKAGDEVNMKPLGVNGWLTIYGIAEVAKGIQGDLTTASLVQAMRRQTKPINLQGLVRWAPGRRGPAAFPRYGSVTQYYLTVRNGRVVSWGRALPPSVTLVDMKYVR